MWRCVFADMMAVNRPPIEEDDYDTIEIAQWG